VARGGARVACFEGSGRQIHQQDPAALRKRPHREARLQLSSAPIVAIAILSCAAVCTNAVTVADLAKVCGISNAFVLARYLELWKWTLGFKLVTSVTHAVFVRPSPGLPTPNAQLS